MTEREHPAGINELVDALLEGYAPISVLLDHVVKAPSHATVDEVRAVLAEQLRNVLEPLAITHGEDVLRTTAEVVEATVPLITENLVLVPHRAPRPRADGRRRQRRGGRRNVRRT